MPETEHPSIRVAHHLTESHELSPSLIHSILEIAEAILLAAVAIATAWSGYQAARWTGLQSELYTRSGEQRMEAEGLRNEADRERFYNAMTIVEWVKAGIHNEHQLSDLLERRFLPELRPLFDEWKKTDPLHNPHAAPGPTFMPEYYNFKLEEATRRNREATRMFEQGNLAQQHSDDYVRVTVKLATVLLLIAVSQRFKIHVVRLGLAVMATLLLCLPIYRIFTLPRA